jgi:serine/threonine protein kinase
VDSELPRFDEHYELGPEIGRGAFGAVHRATRRSDGAPAAAKLLRQVTADARARVRREAALVRDLEHPHLVRLHGVFADQEGQPVLVYDLIEGTTLQDQGLQGGASAEEVIRWVGELAEALRALHEAGLVHRDLKPENVMIDAAGRVRLLDYGLARPEEQGLTMTAEGMVLGTPSYMAPEVFDGERPSTSDDVYALACLAYTALAGRPAHQGETPFRILETKRFPCPRLPQLAKLGNETLGALDAVFARALAPERTERYPDPRALAEALSRALGEADEVGAPTVLLSDTRPVLEPPAPPGPMSTTKFLRRATARGAPLVALLVLFVVALRPGRAPSPAPLPEVAPAQEPPGKSSDAQRLAEDLVQELEALGGLWIDRAGVVRPRSAGGLIPDGGRPLVGEDPLLFGPCVENMPSLREHLARRARGEVAWHDLPEADREALLQVAADFRGQGLPDPFWPLLDVRPGEPMPPEDHPEYRDFLRRKFNEVCGEVPIADPGPWLRTAWARIIQVRVLAEALQDDLERPDSQVVRDLGIRNTVTFTSDPLAAFGAHFHKTLLRPELDHALRDSRRAYQAAIWAVGLVLRFAPQLEAEQASHMLWEIAADYRFLFLSHLTLVEPEALLGTSASDPAAARARFRLHDTQRRSRDGTHVLARNEAPDPRVALARRMLESPVGSVIAETRVGEGLEYLEDELSASEYRAICRELREGHQEPHGPCLGQLLDQELGEVR